jgi:hypothetical protein
MDSMELIGEATLHPSVEEYSPETIDVNLQLNFRLNFFTGGSSEQLVYFFASNFIAYDAKNNEEM